jgi:hypothetical protein
MANTVTPYHVSPVSAVVTEIWSELKGLGAIAYHSCKNCPPPTLSCAVLAENVSPAVSFTENAVPSGKQSHPTMTMSPLMLVVSAAEQEVT